MKVKRWIFDISYMPSGNLEIGLAEIVNIEMIVEPNTSNKGFCMDSTKFSVAN